MDVQPPRIGIGVFVLRNGRFLMGLRKGAHGQGTWSLPGGHLEHGESFDEAAQREVWEETGVEIRNTRFGAITNDLFEERLHYVTIWMVSDFHHGVAEVREPDKFTDLRWVGTDDLPDPLFHPWRQLLGQTDLDSLLRDYLPTPQGATLSAR
ncbi:8-oxo-dGTP diphosphatase [Micromonospora echinofusca]|uniref:8-oxo-dGTP diphosphatase n=1 Tax=Micromonospora echinofusca TaxID=47858 RepID=A0A1C5G5K5_MICEH|nr:NUDIX domain-containing protein [Micromonospora echinofusca]SCG14832.1 8-oxo-dGTP diphosphatase [Micromonospora echinofusca]